ncbi:MAG: hypothetical protein LBN93_11090 [Candidatus Symbiothrix sp.]|nr:hypothetical protein [Candidatus Symbiothrix sp.]
MPEFKSFEHKLLKRWKHNVEKLIQTSLEELRQIDNEGTPSQSNSRLIFPVKGNHETRISEQEARFLFVKQIENQPDFYYSVETPTSERYRFTGVPEPRIDPKGKSGSIDVCLYERVSDQYERKHLIEFKAHNVDVDDFKKDFLKLKYENNGKTLTNYFVHILKTFDAGTIDSLKKKYQKAFEINDKSQPITNSIIIALCFLELKPKYSSANKILFLNECNFNEQLDNLKKESK